MFRDAIISASNNIANNRDAVDALNVFPVPDGDTGTNMSLTMQSAAAAMEKIDDLQTVGQVADIAATALLRGARGNSGVILSLIFRGIAEGFKGSIEATGPAVAAALMLGANNAYKSVMNPTEGTILTVIRISGERSSEKALIDTDAVNVFEEAYLTAEAVLKKTPEMLPVLRRANVVDAGGQGLVYVLYGMLSVFKDGIILEKTEQQDQLSAGTAKVDFSATASFFENEEINFAYCTEFIINKHEHSFLDALLLRSYLESIGDCVVVVEENEIIKVHVHSNEPGNVITKALDYGTLVNVKIDNMRQQHKNASWGLGDVIDAQKEKRKIEDEFAKPYGFVTVCSGQGIEELFASLGADGIVSGGQTMNPSTGDILNAAKKIKAENIFVLPNNKNIIMAAQQAVSMAEKNIIVIPTKNIPQGISAMLNFDETADCETNKATMLEAVKHVKCAQITYAARDSFVNGQAVKTGAVLGLENGKITEIGGSPGGAAYNCVKRMVGKNTSVITVYYGEEIKEEEAMNLGDRLRNKFGSQEVEVVYGGQPVYYYIVSCE